VIPFQQERHAGSGEEQRPYQTDVHGSEAQASNQEENRGDEEQRSGDDTVKRAISQPVRLGSRSLRQKEWWRQSTNATDTNKRELRPKRPMPSMKLQTSSTRLPVNCSRLLCSQPYSWWLHKSLLASHPFRALQLGSHRGWWARAQATLRARRAPRQGTALMEGNDIDAPTESLLYDRGDWHGSHPLQATPWSIVQSPFFFG